MKKIEDDEGKKMNIKVYEKQDNKDDLKKKVKMNKSMQLKKMKN